MEIFITADGSPTLTLRRADGYGEKMHHSGGALSESLYIYHATLVQALERGWPGRTLSFGLGLAYNELLAIAEFTKRDTDWKIYSFESEEFLREGFCRWLNGRPDPLTETFDTIVAMIAEKFEFTPARLKTAARDGLRDRRLELRGPFPQDAANVKNCDVVFYDAFSNKMDSSPWNEEPLVHALGECLAPNCILTTYAATGNLNRALKRLNFKLQNRPGFQGKRESTLAVRGHSGQRPPDSLP